jgi:hypothetical protein
MPISQAWRGYGKMKSFGPDSGHKPSLIPLAAARSVRL